MIEPSYCVLMARYNAWQNRQMFDLLEPLALGELTRERGAFFGSILGTLNHLLWGDLTWMSRLDGGARPEGGIGESPALHPTLGAWDAVRFHTDGRIRLWADRLDTIALTGDLTWFSGATGRELSKPLAQCVVHMFNHQTHHRGQVHAMMTAAGIDAPVSDLIFMPDAVR